MSHYEGSSNNDLSEVQRLLAQIRAEQEAARRGLSGSAIVSCHDFITARTEHLGQCYERMATLMGEAAAMALITDALAAATATGEEPHV
jgi:hypothetical protein